jgi:tRNA (cmo5U34)-methyltransferase
VFETSVNRWRSPAHALAYLQRADGVPHRSEGEAALLEHLPSPTRHVLDLGSGDGRLLALVRLAHPESEAVAVDFSPTMLDRLRMRFDVASRVTIVAHDMELPLPLFPDTFDAIVSSFAIHHLSDDRKRALYEEIFVRLRPGGALLNLEHVASPTAALHEQFLRALDISRGDEDPSNKLMDLNVQLGWLRDIGFVDVDCHWKWRELALLGGRKCT